MYLHSQQRGVITLFAILGVGLLALGASLTLALGTLSNLTQNRNTVSGDQVFYTSESGVSEGAYQYLSTSSYHSGAPVLANGAATGTITVTPLAWPYVKIQGTAANGKNHRAVNRIISVFPEGKAFTYGVYTQSTLDLNSGSLEINGNIFANGGIDFKKNADINGDAWTAGNIDGNTYSVSGTVATSVTSVAIPPLDLTPYRNLAQHNGTLFATSTQAEAYINSTPLNNAFVVNDGTDAITLQNVATGTGSIVTAGGMTLRNVTFSASSTSATTYAAIIVGGDLDIDTGANIYGIVYVKGKTTFTGNGTITLGSLISGGDVEFKGNSTVTFDPNLTADWTKLAGIDKDSTSTPEIIHWGEE